jgi:hypothetical protein
MQDNMKIKRKTEIFEGVTKVIFKYSNIEHVIERGMSPSYIGTTATVENSHLSWNSYFGKLYEVDDIAQVGTTLVITQRL